ncbi:MAG: hypothetical protein V7L12_12950, partial [Nostoc sp.]
MKTSALLLALPISILANFSLPASADSTAGILLSTKCRGGYNVNIWQNYTSGELLYRATSPNGNLSLGKGTTSLPRQLCLVAPVFDKLLKNQRVACMVKKYIV